MGFLLSIVGQLIRKVVGAALAGLLVWGAAIAWLATHDHGDFGTHAEEWMASLQRQESRLRVGLGDVDRSKAVLLEEIGAQEERAKQAAKVIATLRDLESLWDRYVGNPAQQKANAEQIKRMEEMKSVAQGHLADLRREFRNKVWEGEGLEREVGKIQAQIAFAHEHDSWLWFYQDQAWRQFYWAIIAAPILYLLCAWLGRLRAFWRTIPDHR